MKRSILITVLGIGIACFSSGRGNQLPQNTGFSEKESSFLPDEQQKKDTTAKVVYTCPMHPEIVQDKAGKCPKCGMNLTAKEIKKSVYTCPMHSEIVQDKAGKCPKCGMNLVLKEPAKKASAPKK